MIRAQAPCKVIITGEHGVVHGSPALAMAIEPFNTVTLTAETGPSQIILKLKGKEVQLSEKGEVINGGIEWKVYIDLIKHFIQNGLLTVKEKITIEIESSVPKGVGASSSVAVAMAVAVFKYIKKPLLKEALFEAGQFVDKIAHGGSPSGIDAMTVTSGSTKLIRTVENGELKWNFYPEKVSLPSGTELIVADTFKDGKRSGTGEMVKKVSKALGLLKEDESVKPLTEFTVADKKKIEQFKTIFQKIEAQLKPSGDAVELGKLMNKNHELLAKLSATTPGIEEARNICLENGALGAKLTGAGGQGGAVIALIKKADAGNIITKLKQSGFNAFEAKPTRGAAE
ncbi:hypothetical protein HY571_02795 [Candidatus Micrarchaeota archaeon]|nr:hypothetical protein [Candidatus Micrarchaeota archaeon]